MAFKRLSTESMATVTAEHVRRGSPERRAIEAVPEAAALLPQIERVHDLLMETQPITNVEIARLTRRLSGDDALHDQLVRGLAMRIEAEVELANDPGDRETMEQLLAHLFPTGMSIVNRSWIEEAGEGKLREVRVTDAQRRALARMKTFGGVSLLDHFEMLQRTAASMDVNERRRSELLKGAPTGIDSVRARNQWIRVMNALAAVLAAAGVDETPILGRLRELEARAEGRVTEPEPEEPEPTPEPEEPAA